MVQGVSTARSSPLARAADVGAGERRGGEAAGRGEDPLGGGAGRRGRRRSLWGGVSRREGRAR